MYEGVIANVGQVVTDAVNQLDYIREWLQSTSVPPTHRVIFSDGESYTPLTEQRDKLKAYANGLKDKSVNSSPVKSDTIDFITSFGGSGGNSRLAGGSASSGAVVTNSSELSLEPVNPSGLQGLLSSATPPPDTLTVTNVQFPNITLNVGDFRVFPVVPVPPVIAPRRYFTHLFESSILDAVLAFATPYLNGTCPAASYLKLNSNIERHKFELAAALKLAVSQTGARGFRLPNQMTTTQFKPVYESYFDKISANCEQFVESVAALLSSAIEMGLSVERLQVAFTEKRNELEIAIAEHAINRYLTEVKIIMDSYTYLLMRQDVELAEMELTLAEARYNAKETALAIAKQMQPNDLRAAYARNLIKFAGVFSDANSDYLKEKQLKTDKKAFEMLSEQFEDIAKLENDISEMSLEGKIDATNAAILKDKLHVLQNDLHAYKTRLELADAETQAAVKQFQTILQRKDEQAHSLVNLTPIMAGSAELVSSMSSADIKVRKRKA